MKARVKAKNCKIKVTTYFNEYYLNFNADDVLEIEVDEKVTDFVFLVKRMREAQTEFTILDGRVAYKINQNIKIEAEEYAEHAARMYQMVSLESEVDEYLKKMEEEK